MRTGFCQTLSIFAAASIFLFGVSVVRAQPAPIAAPAADPRLVAAQKAFELLTEAERKAIQTDLVWSGDFSGAASGTYGPLTFRAINAIKAKMKAPPDGILLPGERKVLADAARQARAAVGFETVTDTRSGVRLGLPKAILPKTEALPTGGSRWQSTDGKITLDTRIGGPGDTLQALFDKVSVSTAGRNVSYKLIRPDFYVVSGETAGGKFFSRMASGPAGIRGFSIGYDKALSPTFDRVVLAIANSFEPFPGAAPVPVVAGGQTSPGVALPVRPAEQYGTGVIVARDRVLTASAALAGCKSAPRVQGKIAQIRVKDDASGLALLEVEGLAFSRPVYLRERAIEVEQRLVVMAHGETALGPRAATALPARVASAGHVAVPLQPGGAGSLAYDVQGLVAGVITGNPSERYMVAGVAVQRSYKLADSTDVNAFLGRAGLRLDAGSAAADMTTGAIAEKATASLVGITCGI